MKFQEGHWKSGPDDDDAFVVETVGELPDGYKDKTKWEFDVHCGENCRRGWVAWYDALEWSNEHVDSGHSVTIYCREKKAKNSTDLAERPKATCTSCGGENGVSSVDCRYCGALL